jgi:purine catabolism regulator
MSDYIKNIIEDMKRAQPYDNEDSLTVEEVLKLPTLKGYKLIAGANGLKKRCKHITILETPTGISWLEGGEFLLTAGYAFVHNEEYKKNMLKDAHNKNVSSIAIKEDRFFGYVSKELINQADEFDIPLILIPYNVVYTRTISSFYNMLFYRKNEYILNLNNIYEKLLSLSFENKDINEIIKSLSDLSNSNVFLFNTSFKILSSSIMDRTSYKKICYFSPFNKDGNTLISDFNTHIINMNINNCYVSIYPIESKSKIIAYMLVSNDKLLDKLSLSSIEYGLSIIAVKLEMNKASQIVRNNVNKSLVEIMLYNKDLPNSFYQNIESDLGWNIEGLIVGVCVGLHLVEDESLDDYIQDIYNYLNNKYESINYLSFSRNDDLFIFCKYESNESLEDFVSEIYNHIKPHKNKLSVSIGVSNSYSNLESIEIMRDESYLASLFTKKGIIYYNSLDTIRLLYPLKDDKEIQEYYKNTIKKIEKYDELNNCNLVKTLETYFRYNLKKNVVADKLFIHVETLRYRLNKIEEITGYSLNDSEGLFALQMGIKLRSLLKLK